MTCSRISRVYFDMHVRCAVADYAARAGVPVVRFMPENFGAEDFIINQERPAAFVFASEADAKRSIPYQYHDIYALTPRWRLSDEVQAGTLPSWQFQRV